MFKAFALLGLAALATAMPMMGDDERALNDAGCGVSKVAFADAPSTYIVGGSNANKGQYPWMVSVVYLGLYHMCGATIIDDRWVLCAAHCFSDPTKTNYYTMRVGAHDFTKLDANVVDHKVTKIINHPQWNSARITNDVALVKLSTPINFGNNYVNRVCLPPTASYDTDNKLGRIVGWGDLKNVTGTNLPSILQHADIDIKDSATCKNSWGTLYNHTMQVCAKSPTTAICSGDSGGPIHVKDTQGRWVQVGISSFVSSGGCLSSYPVVFTRVSTYMDWIKSTIAANP